MGSPRLPARSPRLAVLLVALSAVACEGGRSEGMLPRVWTEPHTGMQLVLIRPGTFTMGSPPGERGREEQERLHQVTITRPFYLARHEVTQAQWERVMGSNPSHFKECGADCPVESVSHDDIREFIARLEEKSGERFRLPTEAEWEYACRAGTTTAYSTGEDLTAEQASIDEPGPPGPGAAGGGGRMTARVGSYPPNGWGLYDMHGNVWEWCEDRHCPYPESPVADPLGSCGSELRVIRGGSWHFGADSARCSQRYTHADGDRGFSLGFRLVRELSSPD